MKRILQNLAKIGFWPFVISFSILAIVISESLIFVQSYWLTGDFFNKNLLIVGFLTPAVDALIVFFIIGLLLEYLRKIEREKDSILVTLEAKSNLLRNIIDINPNSIVVKDFNGKFLLVNNACANLYGSTPEEMLGKDDGDYILDAEQAKFFRENVQSIMKSGVMQVVYEESLDVKAQENRSFKSLKIPYKNSKNEDEILVIAHDITEEKRIEEELTFLNYALERGSEAMFLVDESGKIVRVNQAACRELGYTKEELTSLYVFDLNDEIPKEKWQAEFLRVKDLDSSIIEVKHRRKDGSSYPVELSVSYFEYKGQGYHFSFSRDLSEKLEQKMRLEHMAHYDSLTNLPNRTLLADRIEQAISQNSRREELIAIAYIDLDGFKEVNDKYGHDVGDMLLRDLSLKMTKLLRKGDTISRFGGDEFVALLVDIKDKFVIESFLERFLNTVSTTVEIGGESIKISASIGVSYYPQRESISSDQLIRQADQAMYEAKLLGKNRYVVFDNQKDNTMRHYNQEIERIADAIRESEFELFYQPKVNMRSGSVIGFEALIRWNHPERGLLVPAAFLPFIENRAISVDVDLWVVEHALLQLQAWKKEGLSYSISVNMGAKLLGRTDFMQLLEEMLNLYSDVDVSLLVFEILETSTLEDLEHVRRVIIECKKLGIYFSLDDFGTGYSSLTYLKNLPVSKIKIDKSFVIDMLHNPEDLAIVDGVISFARAFKRDVIAEGVESYEHAKVLYDLGCELVQGYAIAKPMPLGMLMEWLGSWKLRDDWKHL